MNKKLEGIEKQVRKELPFERYKATCEEIVFAELGIQFLNTKEGRELEGENVAKEHILKYEQALRVKKAEKAFLETIL